MQLAPIVTRLQEVTEFSSRVFAARDLAAAVEYVSMRTPAGAPSAVVFNPRESAEPSDIIGGVRHRVTTLFSAMTCVRYANNAEAAYEQLDTLRQSVIAKLLGWVPIAGYRELQYASGRLAYSDVGIVIWADEFRTEHYIEG